MRLPAATLLLGGQRIGNCLYAAAPAGRTTRSAGNWVAYNRTPLVRPDWLTELHITAEQAREIEARGNARERDLSIPNETPEFFDERRVALDRRRAAQLHHHRARGRQDPRHGAAARKDRSVPCTESRQHGGPEKRPLWERCLGSLAAHPPMLAIGFTNMHQIVQTRDAVVFFSESLHEARIFRLGGRHPPAAVDSLLGARSRAGKATRW